MPTDLDPVAVWVANEHRQAITQCTGAMPSGRRALVQNYVRRQHRPLKRQARKPTACGMSPTWPGCKTISERPTKTRLVVAARLGRADRSVRWR